MFKKLREIIDAELDGKVRHYQWRKVPSQVTSAGLWFDVSMSPGNPPPKYWFDASPGVAKAAYQSTDGGIYHGPSIGDKFLRVLTALTPTATGLPLTIVLCDYLLYYPSIDEGTTDEQFLDNTITLPRSTDGKGVCIVPITVGTRTAGQSFFVNYTNSEGVSGRISQTVTLNTAVVGTVAASAQVTSDSCNPFVGLQSGDSGVRSIQSVTMLGATDGLFSLLLVKPIATSLIRGIDAPVEKDFLLAQCMLPKIENNAYLNFLVLPQGNLSGTVLLGDLKTITT